jgi:hypothetical protein
VENLGGESNLSNAQRLILDGIKSKLIVLLCISRFADQKMELVNEKGELLSALGKNFLSYSESVRRDVETLFAIKRRSLGSTYREALKALEDGKE